VAESPASSASSSTSKIIIIILSVLCVFFMVCAGGLALLLLPALQSGREAARQTMCSNHLKMIGLAMHNYHDTYRTFPAAVITDEEGRPMRSWRVALLPFMDQRSLYEQYDFNEPWDSPKNRGLLEFFPSEYCCPSDEVSGPQETSYVMIVGEGTTGGIPNQGVRTRDIEDGSSRTILAIEVGGSGIPWMEPRDMTVEEAVAYITNPSASKFTHSHRGGVNVVMADGSAEFLPESIDPETVRRLLTIDDGQVVRLPD